LGLIPSSRLRIWPGLRHASDGAQAQDQGNSSSFTHEHYNGLSRRQVHIVGHHRPVETSNFVTLCQSVAILCTAGAQAAQNQVCYKFNNDYAPSGTTTQQNTGG
jgi:hypothetical protein